MRLKCLGCEALARLIYWSAAQSPHIVDIEMFELGLHNRPVGLRELLQERIDAIPADEYDAIVLGYGVCGKATVGLASPHLPMVIPRAHDCITLYLGDRMRYKQEFEENPGTYWYSVDYVERKKPGDALGATSMSTDSSAVYAEYVEKFGQDNADYLMEVMGAWQNHYQRAVYIDMGISNDESVADMAQDDAQRRGWQYQPMAGDLKLIHKLLMGDWDEDFLRLEPGQAIEMSYDDDVVECASGT